MLAAFANVPIACLSFTAEPEADSDRGDEQDAEFRLSKSLEELAVGWATTIPSLSYVFTFGDEYECYRWKVIRAAGRISLEVMSEREGSLARRMYGY